MNSEHQETNKTKEENNISQNIKEIKHKRK